MENFFAKLRVLDLSTVLAGPAVATFFAELGAEVIKIENPRTGGDVTRSWKLPEENPNSRTSAYFASVNFGKRYYQLDLSNEEDRNKVHELLEETDVLVSNFKHGDDVKFGMEPGRLQHINPRLIDARITGFETDHTRVAYDLVVQAETGFMSMNGTTESGPLKMPVALADVLAAHQLKEGILCALYHRAHTGMGVRVTCSLEAAMLSALVNQAGNFLMAGKVASRLGSLHPNIAPYGETVVTCDDVEIVLAVGSQKQFEMLCGILGLNHLLQDEQFATNRNRVAHRGALQQLLRQAALHFRSEELLARLHAAQIPAGRIRTLDEVLTTEPATSMVVEEIIDDEVTKRLRSVAFRLYVSSSES